MQKREENTDILNDVITGYIMDTLFPVKDEKILNMMK